MTGGGGVADDGAGAKILPCVGGWGFGGIVGAREMTGGGVDEIAL
jgi:hypothetical protein